VGGELNETSKPFPLMASKNPFLMTNVGPPGRGRSRVLPVVGLVLILTAGAFGQTYRLFQEELAYVRNELRHRLGPLRVAPSLEVKNFGRDDNIYLASSEARVADTIGQFALNIEGYVPLGRRAIIFGLGRPAYQHFQKETRLRTVTADLAGGARLLLFDRIVISAAYKSNDRLGRPSTEFTGLVRTTLHALEGSVFFETPRETAVGFVGLSEDFRYRDLGEGTMSSDIAKALDRRVSGGFLEFYYRAMVRGHWFVRAGLFDYDFLGPSSSRRNSRAYHGEAGLRFPLRSRATGVIAFGYKTLTPRAADRKSFHGLTANSEVWYRASRWGLRLGFHRDVQFSWHEAALYYLDSRAALGASLFLVRFLRLDYDFVAGWLDYPEPYPVASASAAGATVKRNDRTGLHSLGLSVRLFRTTGLSFSYNILDWASTLPGFHVQRTFLGVSVVQDF